MDNINDTFFDGYYKEIWKSIIPDELTVKEVDFMISYFGLQPGSRVLDLMCGYGRHTLALARKGMHVTAVDNLPDYTGEISNTVKEESLPVTVITSSVIDFESQNGFDLAICMGNSLNFFSKKELERMLKAVSSSLNRGGHFLVNSWSIAEIAYKNFMEKAWSQIGELKFLTSNRLFFHPSRIETESIIIAPDNSIEIKKGIDYIYSLNEMEEMMEASGLAFREVYSIPGKKKFTAGEPRAYMVFQKQ